MKREERSIELDLRKTPLLRKVVEGLVLMNIDIKAEDNALAVAQGVGPYSPVVEHSHKPDTLSLEA